VVGRRNKFTQKRISTSLRIALSTMWFTAWSSIIGVLLLMLMTPDSLLQVVLGLFFVLAMGICRAIDREVCIIREMEFINQRRGKIASFQSRKVTRIQNVANPLHE
jgi:ABC-type dipeptide/oligopeptide/nickel transport system permease subunit